MVAMLTVTSPFFIFVDLFSSGKYMQGFII